MKYVPLWLFKTYTFQLFLAHVYFRFVCPGDGRRVRDCIASGDCGCNNNPKYR